MERANDLIRMHLLADIIAPRLASRLSNRVVWFGDRSRATVALTFDDGPVPGSTERILDVLDFCDVKAAFFLLGSQTRRYPALARLISERGHEIGFHGDAHVDPWRTSAARLEVDFRIGLRIIENETGRRPVAYRPPYGHLRPVLSRLADVHRLPIVMWDVLAGDFRRSTDQKRLVSRNLGWLAPGSIVVLHDSAGDRAIIQLDALVAGISNKGLSVAPLTSMIT
jgi:peptidoglycan-N-acetylglucosamine deacetylase